MLVKLNPDPVLLKGPCVTWEFLRWWFSSAEGCNMANMVNSISSPRLWRISGYLTRVRVTNGLLCARGIVLSGSNAATSEESWVLGERWSWSGRGPVSSCQRGCTDLFCHPHLGLNSTVAGVKYLLCRRRDRSACQSLLSLHCGDNWSHFKLDLS